MEYRQSEIQNIRLHVMCVQQRETNPHLRSRHNKVKEWDL